MSACPAEDVRVICPVTCNGTGRLKAIRAHQSSGFTPLVIADQIPLTGISFLRTNFAMTKTYKFLTPNDVDHFMTHGYIVVRQAFTQEQADDFTKHVWTRLGMDPNDRSTWDKEKVHMPRLNSVSFEEFAPKAWGAITELVGGEVNIADHTKVLNDSFIVNLGADKYKDVVIPPGDLDNWHVDGDFFAHFLDSPEQGLLVTPLWAPIAARGGGTYIATDGIDLVANYLREHPEGVLPSGLSLTPTDWEERGYKHPSEHPAHWSHPAAAKRCKNFVELTGSAGDIYIFHPLMLHSASKNHTRAIRIITNPPIAVKEPFRFDRANSDEFSLVERKTLQALGVDRLEFKPMTPRRQVVPERVRVQQRLAEEETARLKAYQAAQSSVPVGETVAVV